MNKQSRRPNKAIDNPVYILYYEDGVSWGAVDVVLGVCSTFEKAEELLNHVVENKLLEDYANFELIKLLRREGGYCSRNYVAIYKGEHKEIECWFKIAMIELNSLCQT